jgi:hypothetical protein
MINGKIAFALLCGILFGGLLYWLMNIWNQEDDDRELLEAEPFSVERYYERMEQVALDIAKEKPAPYLLTLWWGPDGLRLNPDGTTEWISRGTKQSYIAAGRGGAGYGGGKWTLCEDDRAVMQCIQAEKDELNRWIVETTQSAIQSQRFSNLAEREGVCKEWR